MHVLVTGCAGFIGSHVAEALLARGDTVTGVDAFNAFYPPQVKENNVAAARAHAAFTLVRGTILDDAVLAQAFATPPDVVVHLAAWAGVRPSLEQPALYTRENVEGTQRIIDAIKRSAQHPRLVFASSSSVYGGNTKVPFHEDDPVDRPVSPYAATKRAGELLCFTAHHTFGLDVSCLRFFTVFGPRQRPEMAIHKFAALIADGKPVPRYGDGSSARDYTFIADIVQGVLAAVDRTRGFRIYNLGNSRTVRLNALIDLLGRALQKEPIIKPEPDQIGDVPITCADITRARAELDYDPAFPLERGLAEFARWFQQQRARPAH